MLGVNRRSSRILLALFMFTSGISLLGSHAFSQSVDCTDLPSLDFTQNTQAGGTYAIWVRLKTETPTATPYVSVDGKNCERVGLPESEDWEWVSGNKGIIKTDLKAGDHSYAFSVTGGAVLADKVLATNDLDCKPVGDGKNCFDQTLSFEVVGSVQQGGTVLGDQKVQALITNSKASANEIEFQIDGKSIARQNSEPYCLVDGSTEDTCGLFNFSTIPEGAHVLRVVGYQEGEQVTERTINFNVGKTNGSALSLASLREYDAANSDKPDNLNIVLDGIEENQEVAGEIVVSADVSGTTAPVKVFFAINNIDISTQDSAPYCLKLMSDGCGGWDSRSLVNGEYTLQIAAVAEGSKTKYAQVPFVINNSPSLYSIGTKRQEVIVGNPNQQLSGKVKITLPDSQIDIGKLGRKIDYSVDDTVIATAYDSDPVVVVDSSKFSSGAHTLSARITSQRGEMITLQSTVVVKNDIITSIIMWIQENILLMILIVIAFAVIIIVPLILLRKRRNMSHFNFEHNITEGYQYNETYQVYSMKNRSTQSLVAFSVVFVGVMAFLSSVSTSNGVKTGFTMELDNASTKRDYSGIRMLMEDHTPEEAETLEQVDHTEHMATDEQIDGEMYIMRLNYSQSVSESTADSVAYPDVVDLTEDKAAPKGGLIIDDDITSLDAFEAETMEAPMNSAQVTADKRANAGFAHRLRKKGFMHRSQRVRHTRKVIVRARGTGCEGDSQMSLRVNNRTIGSTRVNSDDYNDYEFDVELEAGMHGFDVTFDNEFSNKNCQRDLYVDHIRCRGRDNEENGENPPATPTTPTTPTNPTEPELPEPEYPTEPETPTTPTTPPTPPATPTTPPTTPTTPTTPPTTTFPTNGMGPTLNQSLFPPAVEGIGYESISGGFPTPNAYDIGAFRTSCTVSHFAADDPLVYPGQPGAAHMHTFFGNTSTNAYSTVDSIKNSGNSTCSGGILNRTGYWMPSMINTETGGPVFPKAVLVYYKTAYDPGIYGNASIVQAPSEDLRMIAGDANATTVQAHDPYGHTIANFTCNNEYDPFAPLSVINPSVSDAYCPEGSRRLFMEVRFPQCWDGVNKDSGNHKTHMSYPTGSGCPSSHPVAIPEIQLRVEYDYNDPSRPNWRLSSDYYTGGQGGYSSHADWWNGWNLDMLQRIRNNCWAVTLDCHVDYIGGGEGLSGPPDYPYDNF